MTHPAIPLEIEQYESVKTYNRIRNKEIKGFPPTFFAPHVRKRRMIELITYFVEHILKTTAEDAVNSVTIKTFKQHKLDALFRYIEPFPEQNEERLIRRLLKMAYPDLYEESFEDLTIATYKEVLDGKRRNFPVNYFYGKEGEDRAYICFRYLCENVLELSKKEIPKVVTRDIIAQYKLKILLNLLFDSPFDLITSAYPELTSRDFD